MIRDALIAGGCDLVAMVLMNATFRLVAADRGWAASGFGLLAWYTSVATSTLTITTFQHGTFARAAWFVATLSVSTVLGTKFGQVLGQRITRRLGRS